VSPADRNGELKSLLPLYCEQMRDQSGNVDTPDFFDDGEGKLMI